MNAKVSSIGSAISMSVKGISCVVFPLINGMIMGAESNQQTIASCCMFMAVPSTCGFVLIIFFLAKNMKKKSG